MGGPRDPEGYGLGADASRKVSDRVRALMKERGLTQITLAKKMDVPQPHLSNLLSSNPKTARRWQRWHVERAAKALGIPEGELVGGLGLPTLPEASGAVDNPVGNPESQGLPDRGSEARSNLPPRVADFMRRMLEAKIYVPEQLAVFENGLRTDLLEDLANAGDEQLHDAVRFYWSVRLTAKARRDARRAGGGEREGGG